jgi:hypothetical protein
VTWVPRGDSQSICFFENLRLVLLGIDLDLEEVRGRSRARRDDLDGLAGRELTVHAGGRMPMPCWPRFMRSRWNFEP